MQTVGCLVFSVAVVCLLTSAGPGRVGSALHSHPHGPGPVTMTVTATPRESNRVDAASKPDRALLTCPLWVFYRGLEQDSDPKPGGRQGTRRVGGRAALPQPGARGAGAGWRAARDRSRPTRGFWRGAGSGRAEQEQPRRWRCVGLPRSRRYGRDGRPVDQHRSAHDGPGATITITCIYLCQPGRIRVIYRGQRTAPHTAGVRLTICA